MKRIIHKNIAGKIGLLYVVFTVLAANFPLAAFADTLSVDITANGSHGLTLTSPTDSFTVSISSVNAASCELTSPVTSGAATTDSMSITPGHPYYPAVGGSTTFSVTCTDANGVSQSASVTVSLPVQVITPSTPSETTGGTTNTSVPTIDVKANGSDGPVTLNAGDSFTYSWTSTNATSCQQVSPVVSGISTSGSSAAVTAGHPFYPAAGSSVIITVDCTNGVTTATDSVVVSLAGTNGGTNTSVPTIDIKANGSDGPVTLNAGDTYSYTWVSANATSCQQTSPVISGISTAGASGVIPAGHSFYPAAGSSVTLTIDCTNGVTTATDSVVVSLASGTTGGATTTVPTIDIKANGSDGPVTLNQGDTYTYSWTSTNATSCQQVSPVVSGISTSGTSASIGVGHPFYPAAGSSVTLTIDCTNGVATSTDSVVVSVAAAPVTPPPSGGGGGSSCPAPVITSALSASATQNQFFSYTFTASSTSAVTYSVATSSLPTGFAFDPATQLISGTTTQTGTFNVNLTATSTCGNDTKTLVITVNSPIVNGGGGGGGGYVNNGGGGVVLGTGGHHGASTACLLIKDYMRIDFTNDPIEVIKLQAFLKNIEGFSYVTVNGTFDQATFDAVSAFQTRYKDDILTPWGHTAPTGYVYILTLKKVNEIFCQQTIPLTTDEQQEISSFRALIEGLRGAQGILVDTVTTGGGALQGTSTAATTTVPELPIVGQVSPQGQNLRNLAAAVFSLPSGLSDYLQCLYEWLLIVVVAYILGNVLKDVLYKDTQENVLKRFLAKWITISTTLALAIIAAYLLGEWCIILPLLIVLILSLIWMSLFPKNNSIRSSVKAWYLVIVARAKSLVSRKKEEVK